MKKLFLASAFALMGTFAMANNQQSTKTFTMTNSQESTVTYVYKVDVDGICTVYIYRDGKLARMTSSIQPSESACNDWARFQNAMTP